LRKLGTLALILTLAGCSGGGGSIGSLNPLGWFKGGQQAAQQDPNKRPLEPRQGYNYVTDTRGLAPQVNTASVERSTGGVIVRATGVMPAQGFYDAGLVPVASSNRGELAFEFRVRPPKGATQIGSEATRQITVAIFLTKFDLAGVRTIRVISSGNSRTARP